jgi:hypothetical protein
MTERAFDLGKSTSQTKETEKGETDTDRHISRQRTSEQRHGDDGVFGLARPLADAIKESRARLEPQRAIDGVAETVRGPRKQHGAPATERERERERERDMQEERGQERFECE